MAIFINDVHIINPQEIDLGINTDNLLVNSSILRINATAAINLTGFTIDSGSILDGSIIFLTNVNGTNSITLMNNDIGSLAENRILTLDALNFAVLPFSSTRLIYNSNPSRQGWWLG